MRLASAHIVQFCAVAAFAAACATDGDGWGAAPVPRTVALAEGRFALLTLTASRDGIRHGAGVEVAAQFVEYAGPDDDWAMEALGLWLPQPDANGWLDGCRLRLEPSDAGGEVGVPDHRIELLEAGEVSVEHDGRVALDVHYLPDLQVYLSGTVYGLEDGRLPYDPAGDYVLTGEGGGSIAGFSADVSAPATMELVALDGFPVGDIEVPVRAERDLMVEWRGQNPDGIVYLDLYDDVGSASPLLSCAVVDDGRFALPGDALGLVVEQHPEAALRLVARRAQVVPFDLPDFAWARVVFAATDTVFLAASGALAPPTP